MAKAKQMHYFHFLSLAKKPAWIPDRVREASERLHKMQARSSFTAVHFGGIRADVDLNQGE